MVREDYYGRKTKIKCTSYTGTGNLYIEQVLPTEMDAPFKTGVTLSLNTGYQLPHYCAVINHKEYPDGLRMLIEEGYGVIISKIDYKNESYPLMRFNPEKLMESDRIGEKSYGIYNHIPKEDKLTYRELYWIETDNFLKDKQKIADLKWNFGIVSPKKADKEQIEY